MKEFIEIFAVVFGFLMVLYVALLSMQLVSHPMLFLLVSAFWITIIFMLIRKILMK